MPKISVYLPDDLYRRARQDRLSISALAQQAIAEALRRRHNDEWVERVRSRPARVGQDIDTASLLGAVRDDFGR